MVMVMKRLRRKEKQKGKGEKRGDSPSASPKSCRLQHAKATLTVGISVHGSKSTCSCYRDKLLGIQRGYWTHMDDSPPRTRPPEFRFSAGCLSAPLTSSIVPCERRKTTIRRNVDLSDKSNFTNWLLLPAKPWQ